MLTRALALRGLAAFALTGLAACAAPDPGVIVLQPSPVVCDSRFDLSNISGATVREFYFSHASLNSWGVDQLGENVLPPGRTIRFTAANAGLYDFRVVWMNGASAELRRVDICRASRITVTRGGLSAS